MSGTEASMRVSLKRLQKLRESVGAGDGRSVAQIEEEETARAEEERKLSALSPYQRHEFLTARAIRELRELMRTYQDMEEAPPKKHTQSEIARCRQQMRKQEAAITKMGREAQKLARSEKKDNDAKELMKHVENARRYYRQKFRLVSSTGDAQSDDGTGSLNSPITSSSNFGRGEQAPLLSGDFNRGDFGSSIRDDEEFQLFFDRVQKQDKIMDAAFERIHAGVTRLHENAIAIRSELQIQDRLIDDTESKVDNTTNKLLNLNKRLKKTLKDVDSSRMCLYVFLCIVLLGIAGGVLYATGVLKSN